MNRRLMNGLGALVMASSGLVLGGCPEWDVAGARPGSEVVASGKQALIWYDDELVWSDDDAYCAKVAKGEAVKVPCVVGSVDASGDGEQNIIWYDDEIACDQAAGEGACD